MFDSKSSNPLTHIKEINAAGMACLLRIAHQDAQAAAVIFGTKAEIIERLLALDESGKPPAERRGNIETLTDTSVPIFEPLCSERYIAMAAEAEIPGDVCSRDGQHPQFRDEVAHLNRLLCRAFDRLARTPTYAILALNMSPGLVDAFIGLSDQQLLRVEDNAGRPLVRLRLSNKILDQFFLLRSRQLVPPPLVPWLLLCNLSPQEMADMPTIDPALSACQPVRPPPVGRRPDRSYSKETGDLVRMIGELGGSIQTACRLLGSDVNTPSLRRIIEEVRPKKEAPGAVTWRANLVSRIVTTSITLLALRLVRAGYAYSAAQVAAYHYYKFHLAPGTPLVKFEAYVDLVVEPLRRSGVRLAYSSAFEAAFLWVEGQENCAVTAPHKGLLAQGRIGDARYVKGRRRPPPKPAPFREGSVAHAGGGFLQFVI